MAAIFSWLKSSSELDRTLWKVYLFQILSRMHFFSAVLIPFFTGWGGLSLTEIMLLQSWFLFWTVFLEVPTGAIADYLGRKQSMAIGALVNAVGAIVYVSAPNFAVFMLGEFLFAAGFTLISGALEAFVYDSLKSNGKESSSKKILGRLGSFHLAGIMLGALIGSFIATNLGVTYTMLLMAIPMTLAALIGFSLKNPVISKKEEKFSKSYFSTIGDGFHFVLKHKVLKILALDLAVITAFAYLIIWFYQPLLIEAGVDMKYFGLVHALLTISEIIIMSNYAFLEKLFGSKKNFIFASAFIMGAFYLLAGFTRNIVLVIIIILVAGGFGLSRNPLILNYMNKYIPSHQRATVLSVISMFKMLCIAVLAPLAGIVADWSLSYAFIMLGVLAIGFSIFSKVEESHLVD